MPISQEYNRLFHYTTWDGLLGILKTQSLWATHFKFLNDYSELYLCKEKLVEYVSPIIKEQFVVQIAKQRDLEAKINEKGGLDQVTQHDARAFVDAAYSATGEEIYILSFCGEDKSDYINTNGLLSQWRGYGQGGGVIIVLNTRELEKILEIEAGRYSYSLGYIADAIYSDDVTKVKNELSEDLTSIGEHVKSMLLNISEKNFEPPDAFNAFPSFIKFITRFKHRGFSEENEVRIVCLPTNIDAEYQKLADKHNTTPQSEKERKFRIKNGKSVPYIELFDSTDITLPIERIIIGPHSDKEFRAASLKVMLRKANIEISISEIPFIE